MGWPVVVCIGTNIQRWFNAVANHDAPHRRKHPAIDNGSDRHALRPKRSRGEVSSDGPPVAGSVDTQIHSGLHLGVDDVGAHLAGVVRRQLGQLGNTLTSVYGKRSGLLVCSA